MVFAAGMATRGYRPVCAIYSTFLQRAFDPIVHDVCLQKLPVVFCMDRAGLSGDDGPTHHGLFDISYLRGIPEMVLMAPKDEDELADMMKTALAASGPERHPLSARRGGRRGAQGRAAVDSRGQGRGAGRRLRRGHPGPGTDDDAWRRNWPSGWSATAISAAVINPRFVKPLDREMLEHYSRRVAAFVTFEDHVKMGGFGSAVIEALQEMGSAVPVVRIGWPDQFHRARQGGRSARQVRPHRGRGAVPRCCRCCRRSGARWWPARQQFVTVQRPIAEHASCSDDSPSRSDRCATIHKQTCFPMRLFRIVHWRAIGGMALAGLLAWPQTPPSSTPRLWARRRWFSPAARLWT